MLFVVVAVFTVDGNQKSGEKPVGGKGPPSLSHDLRRFFLLPGGCLGFDFSQWRVVPELEPAVPLSTSKYR